VLDRELASAGSRFFFYFDNSHATAYASERNGSR
jgi:hypothetical protein